jgi:hypothetical protein
MTIEFIPRKQVAERLAAGFRLIPGHDYSPGDYAILMVRPTYPEPLTAAQIRTLAARFMPRPTGIANKSAAATSRQLTRTRSAAKRLVSA